MSRQLFSNNASATVYGTLAQGGTTLVLASGTGSGFPTPGAGEYFLGTLYEKDASGAEQRIEIVKVTARASDTLTIERDYEGVAGTAGGFGYPSAVDKAVYFELRWTAASAANTLQESLLGVTIEPRIAPGTADDYYRGDKTWVSFATTLRATLLTGLSTATKAAITAADTLLGALGKLQAQLTWHTGATNNPHSTTAEQVGAMPTSHAANNIIGFAGSGSASTVSRGDHGHAKAEVGLGNVDNTSDSEKNAATATLTNKTLANPVITNYTETYYAPAAGTAFTLDFANGTIQRFTTSGNLTITLPASVAGKSCLVEVLYGGAHTVTFAGGTALKYPNATAPAASSTAGKIDRYCIAQDGTATLISDAGRKF